MEKSIEKSAKTVHEAVSLALEELKADENMVNIEILDEGNKGIFGLIGTKQAKVRVTLKETGGDKAKRFVSDIFDKMSIEADIDLQEDENSISMVVKGDDIGIIIGRRGETLDALQYLASLVVNKGEESYKRVIIDTENYRQKREDTLVKLAHRLAERAAKTKKNIMLEPMNPYERRIIHAALQNNKYVRTYSVGDEPNRKVVITAK